MAAIFYSEQARAVGRALMDARVRLTRAIEAETDTFVSLKDATLLVLNTADATIQWSAPNDITSWTPSPDAGSEKL